MQFSRRPSCSGDDVEQTRRRTKPASSHALPTRRWAQQQRAQEKETRSLESPTVLLREESEHEHEHTSTSGDELLKLSGIPEDTQTWTRFDKKVKPHRTTSASGPLWENVLARITVDDKTDHVVSLEYTKRMNEKDMHQTVPSVRDSRTLHLHRSPVTQNQQLEQSFQTFAALPRDERDHTLLRSFPATPARVFTGSQHVRAFPLSRALELLCLLCRGLVSVGACCCEAVVLPLPRSSRNLTLAPVTFAARSHHCSSPCLCRPH